MRKSVLVATLVAVAIVASACGGGGDDVSIDTNHRRPELLYLGSGSSITALAPASGHIRFQEAGAVPSRDWSVLYTATNDGMTTTLRTLDPATGDELASPRGARRVHRAHGVRRRLDGRVGAAVPRRLRHLPPAEQGPDAARDRAA